MNNFFSLRRAGLLARKDFFQFWRTVLITAGAISGTVLIIALLGGVLGSAEDIGYDEVFLATLLTWGIIAASLAFRELHDKTGNEDFILLPASAAEKTAVRLIGVSVVLPLFIILFLTLASLLIEAVTSLLFGLSFDAFNPLDGRNWEWMGHLVIVQSVFFLGAAWFRKAHLIKTVLTGIALALAFGFVCAVMLRLVFAPYFEDFSKFGMHFIVEQIINGWFSYLFRTIEIIVKIMYYGLLAPFCWTVAWLRVKETQSSDGI